MKYHQIHVIHMSAYSKIDTCKLLVHFCLKLQLLLLILYIYIYIYIYACIYSKSMLERARNIIRSQLKVYN